MMYIKIASILLLSVISIVFLDPLVKNADNYGPYTLIYENFEVCKGPKSKNLTILTARLDKVMLAGTIELAFLVDARIDEMKLQVHNLKESKRIFLWNHKLSNPCKHYAFAAMIAQYLKATNCFVKKGNYSCSVNFGTVTRSFLGNSFFYGTYLYKAELISKAGNIGCFLSTMTFKKNIK